VIKQVYKSEFISFVAEVSVLKKTFEIYIKNIVESFDSTLSHVMQTSNRFPNRMREGSKTNISRHICIITGFIAVELRKQNIHKQFLRIWVWIRKRTVWAYLCAIRTHWEALHVMLSTFHRAVVGAVFAFFRITNPHCTFC